MRIKGECRKSGQFFTSTSTWLYFALLSFSCFPLQFYTILMSHMCATQIQHNHGLAPSGFCHLHKYIWILSLDQCWLVCSPFPYLPCLKKNSGIILAQESPSWLIQWCYFLAYQWHAVFWCHIFSSTWLAWKPGQVGTTTKQKALKVNLSGC